MAEVTIQSRVGQVYAKDAVVAFGPHDIPRGASEAAILFDRSSWPDEPGVLRVDLEWSMDNGATWEFCAGFTAGGGDVRHAGVLSQHSGVKIRLPNATSSRRQIRGTAKMQANMATAITVKVSDAPIAV